MACPHSAVCFRRFLLIAALGLTLNGGCASRICRHDTTKDDLEGEWRSVEIDTSSMSQVVSSTLRFLRNKRLEIVSHLGDGRVEESSEDFEIDGNSIALVSRVPPFVVPFLTLSYDARGAKCTFSSNGVRIVFRKMPGGVTNAASDSMNDISRRPK